jgi:hypothetical protein
MSNGTSQGRDNEMRIKAKNDFHKTEIDLYLKYPILTRSQMKRVNRKLCGRDECQCGGIRGEQTFDYEHTLCRDYNGEYETVEITLTSEWVGK